VSRRWLERSDLTRSDRVSFAVRLTDLVTQDAPLGEFGIILEREEPVGQWTRVDPDVARPVRTGSGLIAYFHLERRRSAFGLPPVNYRFSIVSPLYLPRSLLTDDWEFVSVPPYDDAGTFPPAPTAPVAVELCPSLLYPFPAHTPVIRGTVTDKITGQPLPNCLVFGGPTGSSAITDGRGRYALPLIGASFGPPIQIGAVDRLTRNGLATVTLPGGLSKAVDITIPP
jgi:hypothetical protein